jgi:hypothetical protein
MHVVVTKPLKKKEITGSAIFATTPREIEELWGTSKSISYNYWERNAYQAN